MFLSLSLPLLMGIVTRLTLRPRQQGQQQPLAIDVPWWGLAGGWVVVVIASLMVIPTSNFELAVSAILLAGIAGLLIPEILRGLGTATANGFGKPKNWLWLLGIGILLYAIFIDPSIRGGLILLGLVLLSYKLILNWIKPPKGKGK